MSLHLSAPLRLRQQAGPQPGPGLSGADLLSDLSQRYGQSYSAQSATYDFIELALAAGLRPETTVEFTVKQISPKYYVGTGQFEQIQQHLQSAPADLVVVSAPLSAVHQRNWEQELNLPVLNRHDIIFSIFEQNARTAEGKLQVELAFLRYELPRIVRSYEQLDPLAGGIGTLGPGEQLTERIKRRHRQRIHEIEQRLVKLRGQRALRRRQREKSGMFIASIVGYTNVGKSTLINRLTGSGVLVADQYFATLDPTARILVLPEIETSPANSIQVLDPQQWAAKPEITRILVTDTVGFIDDLPDELVTSFQATLEEMEGAQLLIHLADACHSHVDYQIQAVRKIVCRIGLGETPELLVFNKCDRIDAETQHELSERYPGAVFISARTGEGLAELLQVLAQRHAHSLDYKPTISSTTDAAATGSAEKLKARRQRS